ncbi:GntR family transcriptional regulator [Caballeronia udeis]|uniref:GntR family transcriptional regulator n=1 Tax=Caballeronia udeis TaxID=1232866 RepID=A0A158JQ34_9BURK|nr:GntR family transcriptional regulator [Caballeronia udeis]SAL70541.1 GntR family transcriptional regulator [Caballeronia udeis]
MRNAEDGRTLSSRVFDTIRMEILNGKLLPGQRLKVSAMAHEQDVSVNVVREALNRLAGEKLVEFEPQFGFAVRGLSAEDLVDLIDQRATLEELALRRSIARASIEWQSEVLAAHHRLSKEPLTTEGRPGVLNPEWMARHDEFNFVMMRACGSPRLFEMVRQLAEAAELYHRALLPIVGQNRALDAEHRELLDAILAGDADAAVAVLKSHLVMTRDAMLPLLQQGAPGLSADTRSKPQRAPRRPAAPPRHRASVAKASRVRSEK